MSIAASSPKKHTNHIRITRSDRLAKIVACVIVGGFSIICLYPLLLTLTVSLTPEDVINRDGFRLIPREFTLDTYTYMFAHSGERILRSYGITTFITVVGTLGAMLVTCMLSYAISLPELKYRENPDLVKSTFPVFPSPALRIRYSLGVMLTSGITII